MRCDALDPANLAEETHPPCWTEYTNPTTHFLAEAKQHDWVANAHRSASRELRDKEDWACVGISERDRHVSPFTHRGDIASISVDTDAQGRPLGATIVFSSVPGMTVDWLQRVVKCHLAIDATLGHDVPEREDCPLVPVGVEAQVSRDARGARVVLRGSSPAVADEIARRVRRLQREGPDVPVSVR